MLDIIRFGIKMLVKWGNGMENVGVLFGLWGIWFGFGDVRGVSVGVWSVDF